MVAGTSLTWPHLVAALRGVRALQPRLCHFCLNMQSGRLAPAGLGAAGAPLLCDASPWRRRSVLEAWPSELVGGTGHLSRPAGGPTRCGKQEDVLLVTWVPCFHVFMWFTRNFPGHCLVYLGRGRNGELMEGFPLQILIYWELSA